MVLTPRLASTQIKDFVDYNRGKVGPLPRYHDALANWAKGQGHWSPDTTMP